MYKITLPDSFSGERYGIIFASGEGTTDSEWLANRLREFGLTVEIMEREGGVINGAVEIQAEEKSSKRVPKTQERTDGTEAVPNQ